MSTDRSAILSLPLLLPGQAQKHVTHNEALLMLDALVQLTVLSRAESAPPETPDEGHRYLIPSGGAEAWGGAEGSVAIWLGTGWMILPPQPGWRCFVRDEGRLLVFAEGAWQVAGTELPRLGINATADGTNRLAVAAPATLLTHAGAGHQLKVNKAAAEETASLLFQSNWSGRAEMGLTGSNDFTIKVSPDGSNWSEALKLDSATGHVSGAAVAESLTDITAGRLIPSGWMGLGRGTGLMVTDADAITATGLFVASSTAANLPVAADVCLFHQQFDADHAVQTAWSLAGSARIHSRRKVAGSWLNWGELLLREQILGTVSQSSGLPTGAILESDSNADGRYIRWADGTQICLSPAISLQANIAEGALYRSAAASWTYPAAFVATSSAPCCVTVSGPGLASAAPASSANLAAEVRAWSPISMASSADYHALAVGRWF